MPWVWRLEVANALGKAVTRTKIPLLRALDIWTELQVLPIRYVNVGDVPSLLTLAVKNNLSVYDTCYLQAAVTTGLPLATNDSKLKAAAEANQLAIMTP